MTSNEIILDTNAVLRFIIGDNAKKLQKVSKLIEENDCIVPLEVIAEAIYNLHKSYGHTREFIAIEIKDFITIKENLVVEGNVVRYGCNIFATTSLDFIDCLLSDISWWLITAVYYGSDAWDFTGLSTRYHPILRGVGGQ